MAKLLLLLQYPEQSTKIEVTLEERVKFLGHEAHAFGCWEDLEAAGIDIKSFNGILSDWDFDYYGRRSGAHLEKLTKSGVPFFLYSITELHLFYLPKNMRGILRFNPNGREKFKTQLSYELAKAGMPCAPAKGTITYHGCLNPTDKDIDPEINSDFVAPAQVYSPPQNNPPKEDSAPTGTVTRNHPAVGARIVTHRAQPSLTRTLAGALAAVKGSRRDNKSGEAADGDNFPTTDMHRALTTALALRRSPLLRRRLG